MDVTIIGVDAGILGGIAVLRPDRTAAVFPMPADGGEYLVGELRVLLEDIVAAEAARPYLAVEIPLGAGFYGSGATILKQGRGIGIVEGLAAGLRIPFNTVPASSWTGKFGLHGKDKGKHVALAQRLFPEIARSFTGPRGGAKDGVADAVLIAYYEQLRQSGELRKFRIRED